jgi:hypothetical protein
MKRENRSLDLIANFVNGYASGWAFAVGECFKDALDIKYTERMEPIIINGEKQYEIIINKNGKERKKVLTQKVMHWTQGRCYSFLEGYVVYDTPKAYMLWSEALKHIGLICSVIRAYASQVDDDGNFIPGSVTFTLSRPNAAKDGIETIDQYHLNQNDFIQFLKSGKMKAAIAHQEQGSLF